MSADETRRQFKRDICAIYDVPPWLIGPTEPGERFWWYRTWPRRKWRLAQGTLKRWRQAKRSRVQVDGDGS